MCVIVCARMFACLFTICYTVSEKVSKQTNKQNEQTNEPANQWCGCNRFCQYDKVMRCAVCYHLSICLSEKQCERAIEKWMQDRRMDGVREKGSESSNKSENVACIQTGVHVCISIDLCKLVQKRPR